MLGDCQDCCLRQRCCFHHRHERGCGQSSTDDSPAGKKGSQQQHKARIEATATENVWAIASRIASVAPVRSRNLRSNTCAKSGARWLQRPI
eukprot:6808697-Prymnesium_polylepis.1